MASMGSPPPPYPGSSGGQQPFPPVGSSLGPITGGIPLPAPPAPPPPRGPGVRAPFLAPPKDRNNTRLAITIVVGVLALAVCGAGTLLGLTGLFSWFERDMNEKAQAAVTAFLDDVSAGDFDSAYQQMCVEAQQEITRPQFQAEWELLLPSDGRYGLQRTAYDADGLTYVPVAITKSSGGRWSVDVYVVSEPAQSKDEQAGMSVCGWLTH
ncbi:hypothetical protein [Phytomonospora endophytica]|uniref:DUF4878 domain-containing protein n=1 Tax=Phytomonospora endophytica TaxID=714109 RepID=A0A841FGJ3_9ACTN|nr:hypothetical protein [Phytomonospora endophytica]MBB6034113.1 hypothetical protein [Phytomonospora endophytica]GIG66507.1 hypothetical protein Pen01_28020 [Phytomonospora endophytica]